MNTYKNIISLLLTLALLTALSGCGGKAEGPWLVDREEHWHLNDDGKAVGRKAHTVEDTVCTVCGASFFTFEDELWVEAFNDRGDMTQWLIYDADDQLTQNTWLEYTYGEDGSCTAKAEYHFGALWQETTYATHTHRQETVTYAASVITYNEDGTRLVVENDKDGPVREALYDGETVVYDYAVVCQYDKNGALLSQRKMDGDKVIHETICDRTEDGQLKGQQVYENGKLVREDKYRQKGEVWTLYQRTTYDENGKATTINYDKVADILDLLKKH